MLEPGRAYRVHDVRAGEERVLASLPKWKPGAPPVRIVVPSKSLRLHWIQLLTTRFGAVLGVDVLTHHQLVGTVLKEEEGIPLASAAWARLEAGLQAAEQPVLARRPAEPRNAALGAPSSHSHARSPSAGGAQSRGRRGS